MMRIRQISEFCPKGMQIASPGGASFILEHVAGIEVTKDRLDIHLIGGQTIVVAFYRNVDGGPADVYRLAGNIEATINGAKGE